MDAPIIKLVPQRHSHDCAVSCLATLLGVSYENALVAVARTEPDVCVKGVYYRDIAAAARALGYRLKRRRVFDLETDTGILNLSSKKWRCEHLVVLKSGLIFDTDLGVYDADVYLNHHQAKQGTLLEAEAL